MSKGHETIQIHAAKPDEVESSLISPDAGMALLTWITFFVLLGVLYKFAWKPILTLLDQREESIRKSLDDVDRIKGEMEKLDATCVKRLKEAEAKGQEMIEDARKAAGEAAHIIEHQAREEARIQLENALRDIKEETQKARMILREESADLAIELAGKLVEENLDADKNRRLINRIIKKI